MEKKTTIWETKYANFTPTYIERIIKKIEKPRSEVISELLPPHGRVLLDIACGEGATLLKLANRFETLIGFDIGKHQINKARLKTKKSGYKNVNFRNFDLDKRIPLKDETVDFVICEASLSYFDNLEFILSEVSRVLRQKGVFIVEVPNYSFLPRRLSLLMGKLPKTSSFLGWQDGGTLHYFTYDMLFSLLKDFGLKVVLKTNSGVFPTIRKVWPELLAGDIIYKARKIRNSK